MARKPYRSDFEDDDEWDFVAAYLALIPEDSRQREHDLREFLRIAAVREANPTAIVVDSRTQQSTPASVRRGAYDGSTRRRRSRAHTAFDARGRLLMRHGTQADRRDRPQVRRTAKSVEEATGRNIELAVVDHGYTGKRAQDGAESHGIMLSVVKLSQAKRRFVPRPRRRVVETIFACIMLAR